MSTKVLFAASTQMGTHGEQFPLPEDFNLPFLFCLPNKPAGATEEGKAYYTLAANRPLSPVNTDNRL
eukprot:548965-Heterocapsa_arctica.AAC.1